jgi:hypothetical protein
MEKDWLLPDAMRDDYLEACKQAVATKDFDAFKKHPTVNCIVENSTEAWAKQIRRGTGLPFPDYTPNEVRYAYTWLVIHWLFNFDIYRLVEIGGGYGGMCESVFNNTFKKPYRYFIFDLVDACAVQYAYLATKLKAESFDKVRVCYEIVPYPKHDLCIAWCSWSELSQEAKIAYIEKVMVNAKHLFISSNWDFNGDVALLGKYFNNLKIIENPYLGKIIYT